MKILLTDEEIRKIIRGWFETHPDKGTSPSWVIDKEVAKAQLKKVVELLDKRKFPVENDSRVFVMGEELWQAFKKEAGND